MLRSYGKNLRTSTWLRVGRTDYIWKGARDSESFVSNTMKSFLCMNIWKLKNCNKILIDLKILEVKIYDVNKAFFFNNFFC